VIDDCDPTPALMLIELAPDTLQDSVDEPPEAIEAGDAEKLAIVGGAAGAVPGGKVKTIVSPAAKVSSAVRPEMVPCVKDVADIRYIVPVPPEGLYSARLTVSVSEASCQFVIINIFP
jgi:hypothetical protein